MKTRQQLWSDYQRDLSRVEPLGLLLDPSRMEIGEEWLRGMAPRIERAYEEMARIERGEKVNTDENRMVGHYWLRDPERAPTADMATEIRETVQAIKRFCRDVHAGRVLSQEDSRFEHLLLIGIGGSALGPEFVSDALGTSGDKLRVRFIDNTDPDGIDRAFVNLPLVRTLVVVISKSGGTKETRNGMLLAETRYRAAGLDLGRHAVAVTGAGSELDRYAVERHWLARFPMWDWVGGRTSEMSAVGLLPAALQGIDIDALLEGARLCDEATRARASEDRPLANPAMALALSWHHAGEGRGTKDMVILPYKDRLALFTRYLQQLIMESIGKELDRDGKVVHQGIAVYGNKGSTDQHAYVQQLREGAANFFATFIEVLRDQSGKSIEVEPDCTTGDYLSGFFQGTRQALHEKGRPSLTITIPEVSARTVGALIALYERAVGYYAALINVNAYHQPGVEAGKRAAGVVIALQRAALDHLRDHPGVGFTVAEIAEALGKPDEVETLFKILEHLAANPDRGVARKPGETLFTARYTA